MGERPHRLALLVLGHGVFFTLLVLAWKYALIRSTFGDTAFQVFQWISQPGWDIEAHRYTAIVPQALVKFCVLIGADLRTALVVASLAHVAVGYAVFVLCAHVWRAQNAALGCALAAVLCTRFTFYSPVLEANYLLCYPFLLFGFIEFRARKGDWSWRAIACSVLLLLVPLLVHPAGWMVMVFGLVFLFASGGVSRKAWVTLLAITLTWPLLSRWLFPPTEYELTFYSNIGNGLRDIGSVFSWGSWRFLSMHTVHASTTYLPALLVWFLVIGGWSVLREWRIAVLTFAGPVAFVGVYLITFHGGDSGIMLDRGVLPVATILALCISALVYRIAQNRLWPFAMISITLVVVVKLRDVSFASRPFQRRADGLASLISESERQGLDRVIVSAELLADREFGVTWALPCESILVSALNGPSMAIVITSDDAVMPGSALASGEVHLFDHTYPLIQKGELYFEPTKQPYVRLR